MMPSTRKYLAVSCACVVLVMACGCAGNNSQGTVGTTSTPVQTPSGSGSVTISGTHLLRDGVAWTPKALQLSAFVAAPSVANGVFLAASQHYTPAELLALKSWGADTVRLQIGQPEMDPQSALYSATFVATLQAAVTQARADGLNVILSVQDQAQTGETSPATLPNASTTRAWGTLVTLANNDQGILFELFNEPQLAANATNWPAWQTAHQTLVTSIRALGAKNVILVEGLGAGATLQGAPPLSDPLNSLGYAVHPFFFATYRTTADFDANFGNFAATNVVMATEWSTLSVGYPEYCATSTPTDAQTLLKYLAGKNIGISGFAYDDPGYGANMGYIGSIVQDLNGTPTTFGGGSVVCGQVGFGPGVMLQTEFKTGVVPAP
jgi:endoglucanase